MEVGQFRKRLAEEYLNIFGPRKLLALVYRCAGQGEWFEKTLLPKRTEVRNGKERTLPVRTASVLELELEAAHLNLEAHRKLKKQGLITELPKEAAGWEKRIDELEMLLPKQLDKLNADALLDEAKKWIEHLPV